MPDILNKHTISETPPNTVYIGRGSKWGNPFEINEAIGYTRTVVIEKYKDYFWTTDLPNQIEELRFRNLLCYCAPQLCHGEYLMLLANSPVYFIQERERRQYK